MKFNTQIISDSSGRTASRPCSVIRVSDGRVLANFESRKACALALGIDSPSVSNLINKSYGYNFRIVDKRHGQLQIVDGIREITKPARKKTAPSTQSATA